MPLACDPALSMRHLLPLLPLLLVLLAVSASAQSVATVEQVGSQNLAVLAQSASAGGLNDARIVQVGAGRHVARLDQRGGSTASVEQDGEGHRLAGFAGGAPDPAAAARSFDGSGLVLRQGGVGNQAFVEQHGGAFAEVLQSGSGNVAALRQSGGGLARIAQTGVDNVARVTQIGF